MKYKPMPLFAALLLSITGIASARDLGDRIDHRLDRRGDRMEQRLDLKGDRIQARYDRRAAWAQNHGHARAADRLEARGNQIDRRWDRRY